MPTDSRPRRSSSCRSATRRPATSSGTHPASAASSSSGQPPAPVARRPRASTRRCRCSSPWRGRRAWRGSGLPRAGEVLAQLDRLEALRAVVRREGAPLVLCHTDIGGDNLRLDRAGRLTVLDWDEATIAPPEHDLQDVRGPALADIVVAYLAAGGVRALSLDRFAFALLGRHLADATARLTRILDEPLSPAEDADELAGIDAWGFAQWRALERTLEGVAAALSRAGVESAG